MIIELFGAPGVGKTTFACALTARLRERGYVVEPMLSYRPIERPPSPDHLLKGRVHQQAAGAVRRLIRPAVEMLAMAGHLFARSQMTTTAVDVMTILPPKSIVWSIRLRQYILRLSRSWSQASLASHIVIFDQGFVQAVCTLVLLSRASDRNLIALALDSIPKGDLLIRLHAPQRILEVRLGERQRLQSRMEKLLELDMKTNLESVRVIDHLHELLQKRGQFVTCVKSVDQRSLHEAVARIESEVTTRLSAE